MTAPYEHQNEHNPEPEPEPELEPATPVPDDKDWTWVLDRPCPDCGHRSDIARTRLADEFAASVDRWLAVMDRPHLTQRPEPSTWSPLEYAAHVRDVYELFEQRAQLILSEPDPRFANWDQDVTALEKRYWETDPAVLRVDLRRFGDRLATTYRNVKDDEWGRIGRRSNGSEFTVESLGQYCLHDVVHHLHDVAG